MTGLLVKKYHIAVLSNEKNSIVEKFVESLKLWYENRVVVKKYTDTHSMFEAINVSKAKNKPFDVAVVNQNQVVEKFIIQRANPAMTVIACGDEKTLKAEASKVLL